MPKRKSCETISVMSQFSAEAPCGKFNIGSGKVCPASEPKDHGQSRMNEAPVEERVVVQLHGNSELW